MAGFTEYALTAGRGPSHACSGPDGNVWFVDDAHDKVSKITPGGTVTEFSLTAGSAPVGICSGPDGNLWVVCTTSNKICKVTTAGSQTYYSITTAASGASFICSDGTNLWFTENSANKVAKITTSGTITEFSTGITAAGGPYAICYGPDGNVWFTEYGGNRIAKITSGGTVTEYTTGLTAACSPASICSGPDGNLWVAEFASGVNKVAKVTTSGTITEYATGASTRPIFICSMSGELWASFWGTNALGRIDTAGTVTSMGAVPTASADVEDICVGADSSSLYLCEGATAKMAVYALPVKTYTADGTVIGSPIKTYTGDGVVATVPAVLSGCASDKSGRLSFSVAEPAHGGTVTAYKVYRASSSGGSYVDITSNCHITNVGSGTGTVEDKRPRYAANGADSIPINSDGYYKVVVTAGGVDSGFSNVVNATSTLNRSQVEQDQWDALHTQMSDSTYAASLLGWAYPGYWWLAAAYIAAVYPSKTTQALTDLNSWWTTSCSHLDTNGIYHWPTTTPFPGANSSSSHEVHYQYCVEFGTYALTTAKLLNSWLPGNATATAIATDMRSKANRLGKAMIDHLARFTPNTISDAPGYGGNWPLPASATAWAASTAYTVNTIRRPTVANGRIYRCLVAGTSSGSQPTWPTTDRGYVVDGTVTWQDCTNDNPLWTAGATVPAGMIYRPSTPNNHTYRAMNAGTTHASVEPTWPTTTGGTVTDNGITWKETGYTKSGQIFYGYYDRATYAQTIQDTVTDFLFEVACFFAELCADTTLPDFQPAGTYYASAQTIINDHLGFGSTAQVGCGGVVQGLAGAPGDAIAGRPTSPQYDTSYAALIGSKAALLHIAQGDTLSLLICQRMAAWYESDFATEPRVTNSGYPDGLISASDGADIARQPPIFTVAGRTWSANYLLADSAYHPTGLYVSTSFYKQGGYASAGETDIWPTNPSAKQEAAVFPLAGLAINAAVAGNQSITYTADGVVVSLNKTYTYTADAFVLSRAGTKTYTADAIVRQTSTKTYTADATVRSTSGTGTITYTADGLVTAGVASAFESLVLDGLEINDNAIFASVEISLVPPTKRAEWVPGTDVDGAVLLRPPLADNAVHTIKLRVRQQASKAAAMTLLGKVIDRLQEAEQNEDGVPLVWTPEGSSESMTLKVLLGEVLDRPIRRSDPDPGWAQNSPVITIRLTTKPYGYGTTVNFGPVVSSSPIVTALVSGVPGDVPAEATMIVTDLAGQTRNHLEWAVQSHYYDPAAPNLLSLGGGDLIVSGFAGTSATRSGSSSLHVARGSLTTSPLAICGFAAEPHIGTFKIKARVYSVIGTGVPADLQLRLSWREGDGPLYANDWVSPPAGTSAFSEVDLGEISVPQAVRGTQRWTGQIEAYSTTAGDTLDVDYVLVIPTAEGYGKARAPLSFGTPQTFTYHDEFDQSAGNLNGKTIPDSGGATWATSGDTGDFTIGSGILTRATSAAEIATGRMAIAGTQPLAATLAQVDYRYDAIGLSWIYPGLVLRYVDSTHWIAVVMQLHSGTTRPLIYLNNGSGASVVYLGTNVDPLDAPLTWYRLRVGLDPAGNLSVWHGRQATVFGAPVAQYSDPLLASGGALASGKVGIWDRHETTNAITRNYDNFFAAPPSADAVIYANRTAEIRSDNHQRQDSTGTYYGDLRHRGAHLFLQPAGVAGRSNLLVAKARRNDVDTYADNQLGDTIQIAGSYTPRFYLIPR